MMTFLLTLLIIAFIFSLMFLFTSTNAAVGFNVYETLITVVISAAVSLAVGYYFVHLNNKNVLEAAKLKTQIEQLRKGVCNE